MIKGLIAPTLTPFNDDLTIAEDLFLSHAKWLLSDGGCAGLAPFGTTGEALSVGIDERIAMLDMMIANGINPLQLIPGTGLTNLVDTAHLTRHAVEKGCLGAMILPPFYFKGVPDDGIYNYYRELIRLVDHPNLKIYLYQFRWWSGRHHLGQVRVCRLRGLSGRKWQDRRAGEKRHPDREWSRRHVKNQHDWQ